MKAIYNLLFLSIFFLVDHVSASAQTGNSVGLILNTEDAYNGYTLFTPTNSVHTYLIDNCGSLINQWESEQGPALSAHLTTKGTMIRSGRIANNFQAGGSGGLVQELDWDGNVIWESAVSTNLYHQHHDIKPMPNGNILVLAWEFNSSIDAALLGRDPALITDDGIWTEMILEIMPVGTSEFLVVWEWHLRDHLIQDIDASLSNYGVISDHPELIDLNYPHDISRVDLFHANAIDYNEERDQIVINFRNYDEFYIIDHSTTTEEAAGHSGGKAEMGGDILYRYGNPLAYQRGTDADRKFFQQHGANWGEDGIYKNNIIVFNNGTTRPQGQFSSVEIVTPTWNGTNYDINQNEAYGPEDFSFAYVGTPVSSFFSPRIANATILPNENILVCNGQSGQFFEVNPQKQIVWEYINPVFGNGIAEQGDESPLSDVFSIERYGTNFPGLPVELESGPPIELNSNYDCEITEETVNVAENKFTDVHLLTNPINEVLFIENRSLLNLKCNLFDLMGNQVIPTFTSSEYSIAKSLSVASGYYLLLITDDQNEVIMTYKVIKY